MKINLSRSSWHRRLQRYVLGIDISNDQDFPNLCPYFWLTVFCLFVVPFVWLWRVPFYYAALALVGTASTIWGALEMLSNTIVYPIQTYICLPLDRWLVESTLLTMSPEDVIKVYERRSDSKLSRKVFDRWTKTDERWWETLEQYKARVAAKRREMREEEERLAIERYHAKIAARKAKEQRLMKIAQATKAVAPFVAAAFAAIGLFLAYLIITGLYGLAVRVNWSRFFSIAFTAIEYIAAISAGCLALVVAIYFACVLFKKIFSKCSILLIYPARSRKRGPGRIRKAMCSIWSVFAAVAGGIGSGWALLWQYVKATKDGYCPQIEWEE